MSATERHRDGHQRKRILIVDDEPDITDMLKLGLERAGFSVDAYNDPKEALSHITAGKYDLVLFDIRMPGMNGFDLFREFRKIDALTSVCFMTAFEIHHSEFKTVFPDIDSIAILTKPFSIKDLLKHTEGHLDVAKATAHRSPVTSKAGSSGRQLRSRSQRESD